MVKVKYPKSFSLTRLLYRISVFKSIAIIVPCVIICSFYQCIVDYPCGSANILRTLKMFLVLSMYLIASMVYSTAASGCKIDLMLKTGDII